MYSRSALLMGLSLVFSCSNVNAFLPNSFTSQGKLNMFKLHMSVDATPKPSAANSAVEKKEGKDSLGGILGVLEAANHQPLRGSSTAAVWNEIPEEVYVAADRAAIEGGDYPADNVDAKVWEMIDSKVMDQVAALAGTVEPNEISRAQYVIMIEAVVRKELKTNKSKWEEKFAAEQKLEEMDIDAFLEQAFNDPGFVLDLTGDENLGVEREEFTASVAQFFRAEAQRFPVFLVSEPKNEDGDALKKMLEEDIGVSTRTYEVYGFDEMKMKVKADYDWKEARVDALELVTGSRDLPQVFIGGEFFGNIDAVKAAMKSGKLAEACAGIKSKEETKKDAEVNTKEIVMSGMRIIDEEADKVKAERMIEIEKLRKEKGY